MTLMTPREKTSQLLRELGVRGALLTDPKFRLNLVMVSGAQGERCNARCPHLQSTVKQCYCTLFGQYIERLVALGHVRHQSCSTDPDVKALKAPKRRTVQPDPVPKTKSQLVQEIERLNASIAKREALLLFGALAFGYLAHAFETQKPRSEVKDIVKAKP